MENGRDKGRKYSFWRFGGKLDSVYGWLVGLILVASCFFQMGRHHGSHLFEAFGTAIGHTFVVAVVLFVVFKVISHWSKKT